MIELRTLGELSVLRDGARVRLSTRKEYALLVYLGVHQGRVLWRDHLVALFWAQSTQARGRHSLSQAAYRLRRHLPELALETSIDELWLGEGCIEIDVLRFERALAEEGFEEAVDLYGGAFMEGFWVKNARAFEEWQESTRGRLDHAARQALIHLVRQAQQAGRWGAVEQHAQRLLRLDPFDEQIHCFRLEAIAAGGDSARALAEHGRVCAMIARELGRQPRSETMALRERIRRAEVMLPLEEELSDEGDSSARFVGRAAEFARLREEWTHAEAGRGRAILLSGEAGVGKSRLCYQFMRFAALQGARILESRCHPSEHRLPYSAAVNALLRGLRTDDIDALPSAWAAVVTELLPEMRPTHVMDASIPALEGEGARRRLFEGIARLLETMSAGSPVFFFIDDFHWADESTRALGHYLARRCRDSAIMLVFALRPGEVVTTSPAWVGSENGDQPLVFREIHVPTLDDAAAAQLLEQYEQRKHLQIPPDFRREILDRVSGHPLFLLETLKAIENGEIQPHQLPAAAHPDFDSAVPLAPAVEDFLRQRFSLLSPPAEQTIASLAVLGARADPTLAQEISGLPTETFLRALEELTSKGVIHEREAQVVFSHGILREAAYRALSGVRRRALHLSAAKALQRRSTPCGTLAMHFHLGGSTADAFRHALLAADASEKLHAYEEAEVFLRIAVANAGSDYQRRQAWDRLALFLYRMRRNSEAAEVFALLEEYYRATEKKSRLLTLRINRAWTWVNGATLNANELLDRLDELLFAAEELGDRALLSIVLRQRVRVAHDAGEIDVVLAAARRLAELSRDCAHAAVAIQALTAAANVAGMYMASDQGLRDAEEAVERAQSAGHPVALLAALLARAANARRAGMLRDSADDLARAREIATHQAITAYRNPLLNNYALLRMEEGNYGEAEELLADSEEVARAAGAMREMLFVLAYQATLQREQGRIDSARRTAERLLRSAERAGARWHCVLALGTLGLCALERGRLREAREHRRSMVERFECRRFWGADCSGPELFLARLSATEKQVPRALTRLGTVIATYENRGILCRSRLELERARLLIETDPAEAERTASAVRARAARMGARPLVEKADRVLDRLMLRSSR